MDSIGMFIQTLNIKEMFIAYCTGECVVRMFRQSVSRQVLLVDVSFTTGSASESFLLDKTTKISQNTPT